MYETKVILHLKLPRVRSETVTLPLPILRLVYQLALKQVKGKLKPAGTGDPLLVETAKPSQFPLKGFSASA